MSMIRSITMDGQKYTFYCDSFNTRNGFGHKCEVFIRDCMIADAKCYYLNRTWEMWTYQSVITDAIQKLRNCVIKRVTNEMECRNGWKKLNAGRRKAVSDALDNDAEYQTLTKVMRSVNSYSPAWD